MTEQKELQRFKNVLLPPKKRGKEEKDRGVGKQTECAEK